MLKEMEKRVKSEPRFHGEVSEKSHKNMSCIRGRDTSRVACDQCCGIWLSTKTEKDFYIYL